MVEIVAGLVEAVVRLWDFTNRRAPRSRASLTRAIEEVNVANARLRTDDTRTQPHQESAR